MDKERMKKSKGLLWKALEIRELTIIVILLLMIGFLMISTNTLCNERKYSGSYAGHER